MDTADLLKRVRKIEIKSRGLTSQVFSGSYHSAFKGRGMAFSEVREYQPGDDIRAIDWNVTARFNHPFIKIYEEERELTVMILVDVSGSEAFGTRGRIKQDLVAEICAVLAFSAIQNNDKIGVIFFSDKVEKFIPPKKGRTHILRIIRELITFKPTSTRTNLSVPLKHLTNIIKKRSTCFILSDFMDPEDFSAALKICNRKHDVVGLRIYDERERLLPDAGMIRVADAETGDVQWINTSDLEIRRNYALAAARHDRYVRDTFRKSGADLVELATDKPYIQPLMALFKRREK